MAEPVSFSHIINPFPAAEGSEHGAASRITFASLRKAVQEARNAEIDVEVRAVVLRGEEHAIEPPAVLAPQLVRTVQDIRPLRPRRALPLISDILRSGADGATGSHLIFTNMDIAVQPHFYVVLHDLVMRRFGEAMPFIVYRRNIDSRFRYVEQLPEMYVSEGTVAYGFDCFVFPARYVRDLDLGMSCIGSGHFDNLLFIALEAAGGFRIGRVSDVPLTFHIGNEIEWTQHIDYIEHNLHESLQAITRMQAKYRIPEASNFAHMVEHHFAPNARLDSAVLRSLKRIPGVGGVVHRVKKLIGRSH